MTASATLDTDAVSTRYRAAALDAEGHRLLVTNFQGTDQEQDLSEPPNCNGFGRVRHFRRGASPGWPPNPLPIDPACRALRLPVTDILRAQVFQNAVCNWRCWYCFVPFNLLSASKEYSAWQSAASLVDLYLAQDNPPAVIDLTGGQPDLVPEWVPWMMAELQARGMEHKVYLWSDDNLSNDYFWRYLSDADRALIQSYPAYGRVCCFKGFDEASFAFNTAAAPALFDQQFELLARLLTLDIDLYAYATFTAPDSVGSAVAMRRFVDRLQSLHYNLPLRTVPLEIRAFSPVRPRLNEARRAALKHQQAVVLSWQEEIERRYSIAEREQSIADVSLR